MTTILQVSPAVASEHSELDFLVSLSAPAVGNVTVKWRTVGQSALDDYDFNRASGTLTIPSGSSQAMLRLDPYGSSSSEADENLTVEFYDAVGAELFGGGPVLLATGVILDTSRGLFVSDPLMLEGDEAGTARFEVRLSRAADQALSFSYQTADGSAVAGEDYSAVSGTLTFAAGETVKYIDVPVIGDALPEASETFQLVVQPQGAAVSAVTNAHWDGAGEATLLDDDASPSLPELSLRFGEGGEAADVQLVAILSAPAIADVTFHYRVIGQSAQAEYDYNDEYGTVTIPAGATQAVIEIDSYSSSSREDDENFVVEIFDPVNAVLAGNAPLIQATGVIVDSGNGAFVSDPVLLETDGATEAVFEVRLSWPAATTLTFTYQTVDGSAQAGSDYTSVSGTLTFLPGQTVAHVRVPVTGDGVAETAETFSLVITPDLATSAAVPNLRDAAGEATILDDDASDVLPELTVRPATGGESADIVFHAQLAEPAIADVTFGYRLLNQTAQGDYDFYDASGTVTIPAGRTAVQIRIDAYSSSSAEVDENFVLEIFDPKNAVLAGGGSTLQTTGVILDSQRALFVSDPELVETDGVTEAVFEVRLSRAADVDLTFSYQTVDGTAQAGSDYTAVSGSLTFLAGQTVAHVRAPVTGDAAAEAAETFQLVVTPDATSASAIGNDSGDAAGEATILDDDSSSVLPSLALRFAEAGESGDLDFIVTLSEPALAAVTMAWRLVGQTALDDVYRTSGTLTIAAGATTGRIRLDPYSSSSAEVDENLVLELYDVENAVIAGGGASLTATGLILDSSRGLFVSDPTLLETDGATEAVFEVRLSRPADTALTFSYQTVDGSAEAGEDYTATSGTLTFLPGQTVAVVRVPVVGDAKVEATETFQLVVRPNFASSSAIDNDSGDAAGEATLLDDDASDALPVISAAFSENVEGRDAVFAVTLSAPAIGDVTVNWRTVGQTTLEGVGFSPASGTLTIASGKSIGFVTLDINGSDVFPGDENMVIEFYDPQNGVLAGDALVLQATGVLLDDGRGLFVSDPRLVETNGATEARFEVRLSRPSDVDLTFTYQTVDGSAEAGEDYTATSGTLTFLAGQTVAFIDVPVTGDGVAEAAETFQLVVTPSLASSSAIVNRASDAAGEATILDDDASASLPELTIHAAETRRSEYIEFTLSLSERAATDVTVNWRGADGTTIGGLSSNSGTVTIAAGSSTATLRLDVRSDDGFPTDESYIVEIFDPVNAVLAGGVQSQAATGVILSYNATNAIFVSDPVVLEGDGAGEVDFEVRLSRPHDAPLTFTYQTANGSAEAGEDYSAVSGTLVFAAGQTVAHVKVPLLGDETAELSEIFSLVVKPDLAASTVIDNETHASAGVALVMDDDSGGSVPVITLESAQGHYGDAVDFVVRLSQPAVADVTVHYATRPGTADSASNDYTALNGTLTIAAGKTQGVIRTNHRDNDPSGSSKNFTLELSDPVNAVFADGAPRMTANGTLLNGTGTSVFVTPVYVFEDAGEAVFTIELQQRLATDVTLNWRTVNETAVAGADYQAASGTITVLAGQKSTAVRVPVIRNGDDSSFETFRVEVTSTDPRLNLPTAAVATASIVEVINLAPTPQDDGIVMSENALPRTVDVVANDFDPNGDTVEVASVAAPTRGSASVVSGKVRFDPGDDFQFLDAGESVVQAVIVTVTDGALTAQSTLRVTVQGANDAPVAVDDRARANSGVEVEIDALANDFDPDASDSLEITSVTGAANGDASIVGDRIRYTPDAGFQGTETLTYTITDGAVTTTAEIDVEVSPSGRRVVGTNGKDKLKGGAGDDVLIGKKGNDKLSGGGGDDELYGNKGKDKYIGGGGADELHFRKGDGKDVVKGWRDGEDLIVFDKGVKGFGKLDIDQKGKHTVVDYGSKTDSIKLIKTDADDLDAADFLFG